MLFFSTTQSLISTFCVCLLQGARKGSNEYDLYCTFQSHEAEFDYLKSLEIEEKINKISWLNSGKNAAHFMLTTNDKTIKLWKLSEKDRQMEKQLQLSNGGGGSIIGGSSDTNNSLDVDLAGGSSSTSSYELESSLRLPKYISIDPMVQPSLRRQFSNAHSFHINSISVNSDQETYISADELRINLWNLEVTDESFGELCSGGDYFGFTL